MRSGEMAGGGCNSLLWGFAGGNWSVSDIYGRDAGAKRSQAGHGRQGVADATIGGGVDGSHSHSKRGQRLLPAGGNGKKGGLKPVDSTAFLAWLLLAGILFMTGMQISQPFSCRGSTPFLTEGRVTPVFPTSLPPPAG